jgi:hypothetical protein
MLVLTVRCNGQAGGWTGGREGADEPAGADFGPVGRGAGELGSVGVAWHGMAWHGKGREEDYDNIVVGGEAEEGEEKSATND